MAQSRTHLRTLVVIAVAFGACHPSLHAASGTHRVAVEPASVVVPELSTSVPKPSPSAVPVDLKPRPLGTPRTHAAADRAAEGSGSAAAALWNNSFVRTALSLALVLALVLALATMVKWLARRNGQLAAALGSSGPRPAGLIEVLGRYPIARGQTLILLKLDRRVLLIGQTASRLRGASGSLATLCEITDAESVADILARSQDAEHSSISARFQSLLHRFDHAHTLPPSEAEPIADGRRAVRSEDGDAAELLDEHAVVHRFPDLPTPQEPAPQVRVAAHASSFGTYGPQPHPSTVPVATESYGAIRERLHALRGEAHR